MEKIGTATPDLTRENIEKLAELFPDVVTETYSAEAGGVVRGIDIDEVDPV
jgi:adenine-specific DNA-methyltransferase